jgi:hypothetical protein
MSVSVLLAAVAVGVFAADAFLEKIPKNVAPSTTIRNDEEEEDEDVLDVKQTCTQAIHTMIQRAI